MYVTTISVYDPPTEPEDGDQFEVVFEDETQLHSFLQCVNIASPTNRLVELI